MKVNDHSAALCAGGVAIQGRSVPPSVSGLDSPWLLISNLAPFLLKAGFKAGERECESRLFYLFYVFY